MMTLQLCRPLRMCSLSGKGGKPKDKALVENAVRLLYREVYSKMTGLKINDLEALNIEIMKHTDALNSRKMYNRSHSRKERFLR